MKIGGIDFEEKSLGDYSVTVLYYCNIQRLYLILLCSQKWEERKPNTAVV